MKTYNSCDQLYQENQEKFGVLLGNFDGVHLGHQEIITKVKAECDKLGLSLVIMTFVPHPKKILFPGAQNYLITSYQKRKEIIESLQVNFMVEIPFTRDFSTQAPEDFLNKYLFNCKGLSHIFLGHDFQYGQNKEGNYELALKLGSEKNIKVTKLDAFHVDDKRISSSQIRSLLSNGKIEETKKYLGRSFSLSGLVVKGEGRGKKIGIPTANINFDQDLLMPNTGVYITRTKIKNLLYNSVTNIGIKPTFGTVDEVTCETHILDFDRDIYGEDIEVFFFKKIRDEKKFPTVNDLIDQIKLDIDLSSEYFNK